MTTNMFSYQPNRIPLGAYMALVLLSFLSALSHAQSTIAKADSLAPYEIPYIVGEAQELISKYHFDLNGLKGNIPENVKQQLLEYLFDAFEDSEKGSVQSDLNFTAGQASLRRKSPSTIGKYAIDFETDDGFKSLVPDMGSFRFTFPENPGPYLFEMYGTYQQFFISEIGDTLDPTPQDRLVRFQISRDLVSAELDIRLTSIAFLDPSRMPAFMESEDLAILSQEYLKWRKEGSPLDKLDLMSGEAITEMLEEARQKRIQKAKNFETTLQAYAKAKTKGDILVAAEEFLKAEKLQRQNPTVLRDKDEVIATLAKEIDRTFERTMASLSTWNSAEALTMAERNEKALEVWKNLANRDYQHAGKIKNLDAEVKQLVKHWARYWQKIEIRTFRSELQSELLSQTAGVSCSTAENKEIMAEYFCVLGLIEIANDRTSEKAKTHFKEALKCRPEFSIPKIELAALNRSNPDVATDYYNDLLLAEPYNPNYFVSRAAVHIHKGNITAASDDLLQALRVDPNHSQALRQLAWIHIAENRMNEAIVHLNTILEEGEHPATSILLTYAYLEKDGHESAKARAAAKQYSDKLLDRTQSALLDSLMLIHRKQTVYYRTQTKQFALAAIHYEKMYVLASHDPQIYAEWALAAECYFEMGNSGKNYERALHFAEVAIEKSSGKSQAALLVKGKVNRALNQYADSKDALYKLDKLDPGFMSKSELAETFYKEGLEMEVARVYFLDALDKLLKSPNRSEQTDQRKQFLYLRIGQCYRELGKTKSAMESMNYALKTKYNQGEAYYEMGLTLSASDAKGNAKKSVSLFDSALKNGFDPYLVLSAKASAFIKSKDFSSADQALKELSVKYSDKLRPADYCNKSIVALYRNEIPAASDALHAAIAADPKFATSNAYLNQLGTIELKKYKTLSLSPDIRERTYQNAVNAFTQSLDNDPTDPDAHLGMSILYFYTESKEKSLEHLRKARSNGLVPHATLQSQAFGTFWTNAEIKRVMKGKG